MLSDPTLRSPLQHVSVCVCFCVRRNETEREKTRIYAGLSPFCSTVKLLLWACVLAPHDPVHLNMCVCVPKCEGVCRI